MRSCGRRSTTTRSATSPRYRRSQPRSTSARSVALTTVARAGAAILSYAPGAPAVRDGAALALPRQHRHWADARRGQRRCWHAAPAGIPRRLSSNTPGRQPSHTAQHLRPDQQDVARDRERHRKAALAHRREGPARGRTRIFCRRACLGRCHALLRPMSALLCLSHAALRVQLFFGSMRGPDSNKGAGQSMNALDRRHARRARARAPIRLRSIRPVYRQKRKKKKGIEKGGHARAMYICRIADCVLGLTRSITAFVVGFVLPLLCYAFFLACTRTPFLRPS